LRQTPKRDGEVDACQEAVHVVFGRDFAARASDELESAAEKRDAAQNQQDRQQAVGGLKRNFLVSC